MGISNKLVKNNLISGRKVCEVFDRLYFQEILKVCFKFEGLIASTLYRFKVFPIYVQAKLSFVPNVEFDLLLYSKEYGPVVLSVKTSLRERYKQADLEGMMLRQVHRNAKIYLITLDHKEAKSVNNKIKKGQVLGIDSVVTATTSSFDELLDDLKSLNYFKPEKVEVVSGRRVIESIESGG